MLTNENNWAPLEPVPEPSPAPITEPIPKPTPKKRGKEIYERKRY